MESPSVAESAVTAKAPHAGFRRFAGIVGNVLFAIIMVIMALLVYFLVQSRLSGGPPAVAGHQMYIVLSGSMKPTFDTGSLIFVRPVSADAIVPGDIITFRSENTNSLTTHRVVDVLQNSDGISFVTRGDANNTDDPNPVSADKVVGRMVFCLPYIGYLMSFAQTKAGLIALVFIPAAVIIIFEMRNLLQYASEEEKKKAAEKTDNEVAAGDSQ
ncbi:MAG: signal peptidase I [Firmicutes bacterium]|nr:signal peptidase I [Bacillota bacterium]